MEWLKKYFRSQRLACLDDMFAHVVLYLHLYNNTQFNKMSNQQTSITFKLKNFTPDARLLNKY
ncbi:TPA: hypothetical protein I2T40_03885 [Staphylococcus aureus]|nr:hypothetical protein [Staphylococcus aureus]